MDVLVNARLPGGLVEQIDALAERLNGHPAREAGVARKVSRSAALRQVMEAGLEALDRGGGEEHATRPRVELTPEEDALRQEQAHMAAAAMSRRRAEDEKAAELGEAILTCLRAGPCRFNTLLYETRAGGRAMLKLALRRLLEDGRVRRITVGDAHADSFAELVALAGAPETTPVQPAPRTRRVMDAAIEAIRASRVGFRRTAELAEELVIDAVARYAARPCSARGGPCQPLRAQLATARSTPRLR